jgi:transcriptional regulator with XRE-family HTH domain
MNALVRENKERVGRRIRFARVAAGLSHDKLGAAVGTTRQHLIKLEKGLHMPGDGMLTRIAAATGKPEAYFLATADEDEESDQMADLVGALIGRLMQTPAIRDVVRDAVLDVGRSRIRTHA